MLVVIGSDLDNKPISNSDKELITALCAAGALIGAVVAGVTADMYGRRPAIWFASVLFTVGAVIQASSYTIAQMSVGRVAVGLGVGSASMVSSSTNRPRLISTENDQGKSFTDWTASRLRSFLYTSQRYPQLGSAAE